MDAEAGRYFAELHAKYDAAYQRNLQAAIDQFQKEGYGGRFMGATISPSTRNPGQTQVSYFDEDGFSGHSDVKDRAAAITELTQSNYEPAATDQLKRLVGTRRFMQGIEKSYVTGWGNELMHDKGITDAHNQLFKEYESGGLKAAESKYRSLKGLLPMMLLAALGSWMFGKSQDA